jgi:hypothetical protein
LAEVRTYLTSFPRGHLIPEALFLRMEALDRSGRSDEAKTTARRLVAVAPSTPQAAKARRLIANQTE